MDFKKDLEICIMLGQVCKLKFFLKVKGLLKYKPMTQG